MNILINFNRFHYEIEVKNIVDLMNLNWDIYNKYSKEDLEWEKLVFDRTTDKWVNPLDQKKGEDLRKMINY